MVARVDVHFHFGLLSVSDAKLIRLIELSTRSPSAVQRQMEQQMLKSGLAVSHEA